MKFYIPVLYILFMLCGLPSIGQVSEESDSISRMLSKIEPDSQRVNILNKIGYDYWTINPALSEKYGTDAINLAEKLHFESGLASAHRVVGISHWSRGDLYNAMLHLLKSQAIYRALDNSLGDANSTMNIGLIYAEQKDFEKALGAFFYSLARFKDLKQKRRVGITYNKIGTVYLELRELDKANKYLTLALEIHKKEDYEFGQMETFNRLGLLFREKNKLSIAEAYLKTSLALAIHEKDKEHEVKNLENLSSVYIKQGRIDEAEELLMKAAPIAVARDYKKWHRDILNDLREIYTIRKDFSKAFYYSREYERLKDSIYSEETSSKIANLELEYQAAEQKKILLLKEQEILLQQQQNDIFRIITMMLISGTIISILVVFIFRKQRNRIRVQAKELEHASQLKSRFLTETAHELRTPLTLTLAPIYEALDNKNLPGETMSRLKMAERNGSKLMNLINEIITVSRLEKTALPMNNSQGFPNKVLSELAECFNPFLIDKRQTVNFNLTTSPELCLELDWSKYKKIVSNLLHNAIKFTPIGGDILISCNAQHEDSNHLILETIITDTGEGIEESDRNKIFEPFYQKDKAFKEGNGIGLALVKELVELMGGAIEVKSELHHGSSFILRLNSKVIVTGQSENPKISSAPNRFVNYERILLPKDERKPRLLVVEDNQEMCEYLHSILQKHFSVYLKSNGGEAIQWLEFNNVDIIVSDWMMPVMDGIEFYEQFKKDEKNKSIPFVFLTAKTDSEDRLAALMIGVDEYIMKPFLPKELLLRINRLLHLKEVRKEEKVVSPELEEPEEYSLKEKFIQNFKEFVEKNIEESSVKISDLCDELAVSERQLHYKVKSLTGITPAHLVREIKLQHVRRMLEKGQIANVSGAANSIGFGNVNHFSKLYEQRFGRKPSSYFRKN